MNLNEGLQSSSAPAVNAQVLETGVGKPRQQHASVALDTEDEVDLRATPARDKRPSRGEPSNGRADTDGSGDVDEGYSPDTAEGKEEATRLVVGEHFHVHTIEEIANASDEPPPWIIQGMLCEKGIMTRSGRAKSCKSWDALNLDLSMAIGAVWHGRELKRMPTVYVNLELPHQTLMFRVKKIAAALGIKDVRELEGWFIPITINCGDLMVAQREVSSEEQYEGMYCHLLNEQIEWAIRKSKMNAPGLVSIDSFYRLVGGLNENDAGDVTTIYRHLHRLSQNLGAAIDLTHHFSKGDPGAKMEGDRAAGSRVHRQEPNTYVEMTPHQQDDVLSVHVEQRDYRRISDYCLRWDFPLLNVEPDLDPKRIKRPRSGREPKYDLSQILEPLSDGPLRSKEWLAKAKQGTGMSKRTFFREKKKAVKDGKVVKNGRAFSLPKHSGTNSGSK